MGAVLQFPIAWPQVFTPGMGGLVGATINSAAVLIVNSDTQKLAFILQAPKAFNLRKIHFRIGTDVTTDAAISVRVETIDAGYVPTGTLWATNTSASSPTTHVINTSYSVTLTADATLALGDKFAIVFARDGAGTIDLHITRGINSNNMFSSTFPYSTAYNGTTWTRDDYAPHIMLEDDAGNFVPCGNVYNSGALQSSNLLAFANGDTNNENGNRFVMPFTGRCIGAAVHVSVTATASDYELSLYDSTAAPSSALRTITKDDNTGKLTGAAWNMFYWSPLWLKSGDVHQLAVYALDASNVSMERIIMASNAHFIHWPGGVSCYRVSRTRSGPGTFSATTTELFPLMCLLFDQIADLKVHPGMRGGING